MFETIIAYLLSRLLGHYFENIRKENIKFSLSGDLVLKNLIIKKSLFDGTTLPMKIRDGFVGRFRLVVPWASLNTKPSILELEDVFLIAAARYATFEYSPQEEEEQLQIQKQRQLQIWEVTKSQAQSSPNKDDEQIDDSHESKQSLGQKIFAKILRNLQIYVTNIHFRYEDNITNPDRPFAVGVTLERLERETNEHNEKQSPLIVKLLKFFNFSIYWNVNEKRLVYDSLFEMCQKMKILIASNDRHPQNRYLVEPLNGSIKGEFLKDKSNTNVPQITSTIVLDFLKVNFDEAQFADSIDMNIFIDSHYRRLAYRKFRPKERSAKAMWQFAVNAIMHDVEQKRMMWKWETMKKRRVHRIHYIELWKKKLSKKKFKPDEKKQLAALERILSFEDIALFRCFAAAHLRYDKELESKKGNWFTDLFTSKAEKQRIQREIKEAGPLRLNDEERREIFYLFGIQDLEIKNKKPSDAVQYKLRFSLDRAIFRLLTDTREAIGSMILRRLRSTSDYYSGNMRIVHTISLSSVRIKDESTPRPTTSSLQREPRTKTILSRQIKNRRITEWRTEITPKGSQWEYKVLWNIKPLNFVYNKRFLERLVTFYLEPKTKYRQERIETRNRRRTEQQQLFIWSTFEIKFHKPNVMILSEEDSLNLSAPTLLLPLD